MPITELASRVGRHENTVTGWEQEEHEPSASDLFRLSVVLGVSTVFFMADDLRS